MNCRRGALTVTLGLTLLAGGLSLAETKDAVKDEATLGLPKLDIPANNPMTPEKIALGEKLFNEKRFSSTGTVSCSTCHDASKSFTDALKTSKGVHDFTGTRNAPTAVNAAFGKTQFWDGRAPSLEEQSKLPLINSIEMGLKDHEPVLAVVRTDAAYVDQFKKVFGKSGKDVTMTEVSQAIAAFERTLLSGNSRFDRWYFKHENTLSEQEVRGFQTFIGNGRCVSCHVVEQTSALFTDHLFHNIGVGINHVPTADVDRITGEFLRVNFRPDQVDEKVLKDPKTSEIGRVAITHNVTEIGAFKTPTLRNIEFTAPYMHDGSLKTLEDVVEHYNRGGASSDDEVAHITPFLDGGIRPLNLTNQEKGDLVAFLKALGGAQYDSKGVRK